jgi:hypothetical protein
LADKATKPGFEAMRTSEPHGGDVRHQIGVRQVTDRAGMALTLKELRRPET